MQLVREHSATTVSARSATVDWSGIKSGNGMRKQTFTLKKKAQMGNDLPKTPGKWEKSHRHQKQQPQQQQQQQ